MDETTTWIQPCHDAATIRRLIERGVPDVTSAIMLSPEMYDEFNRPCNGHIERAVPWEKAAQRTVRVKDFWRTRALQ